MNIFPHRLAVVLRAFAMLALGLLFTGCISRGHNSVKTGEKIVEETLFWRPERLYLQAAPHTRLYVEIDAVQGTEPDEATLQALRDFLGTYCQKPEGIQLVRDDVISKEEARSLSPAALTRRHLDGPPQNDGQTAYLYLLYYDGALCDRDPLGPDGKPIKRDKTKGHRGDNPHVDLLPYPAAIFVNSRYGLHRSRREILVHEAGHVLGLARRAEGTQMLHCLTETCLMQASISFHISRWLTLRDPITQHEFCADCRADLQAQATGPAAVNLRFIGSVMVRTEPGYHVLSLPGHAKLQVGPVTDADCAAFAAWVKAGPENPRDDSLRYQVKVTGVGIEELTEVINRAKKDPLELIRQATEALEKAVKSAEKDVKK